MTKRAFSTARAPLGARARAAATLPCALLLGGCAAPVHGSSTAGRALDLVVGLVTVAIAIFMISLAERMVGEALSIVTRLIVAFLISCTVVVTLFSLSVWTVYDAGAQLIALIGIMR